MRPWQHSADAKRQRLGTVPVVEQGRGSSVTRAAGCRGRSRGAAARGKAATQARSSPSGGAPWEATDEAARRRRSGTARVRDEEGRREDAAGRWGGAAQRQSRAVSGEASRRQQRTRCSATTSEQEASLVVARAEGGAWRARAREGPRGRSGEEGGRACEGEMGSGTRVRSREEGGRARVSCWREVEERRRDREEGSGLGLTGQDGPGATGP